MMNVADGTPLAEGNADEDPLIARGVDFSVTVGIVLVVVLSLVYVRQIMVLVATWRPAT